MPQARPQAGSGPLRGNQRDAAPPPAPAQLPADIPDFTGRADQVEELCGLLSAGEEQGSPGAVPVVLVMGSGGLGKTTLAVHAAHLLAERFGDGQLYASLLGATEPVDPGEILARFLRDLGMDGGQIPVEAEERAAQYRTRLAGKRVLVVLDDARDAAQVRPLLPGSASCAVLITSRGRLPELAGSGCMDLDVLAPAEARALFERIAGHERTQAEPAATEEVLAACAGLPLAIRIAGARLASRGGWNVRTLADRLSDEHRRLDELRAGNLAVRACFEVSFASLAGATGGAVIPRTRSACWGCGPGRPSRCPRRRAARRSRSAVAEDALEVLVDVHLLDSPEPDGYRFHDLLRVYAADRAQAQESEQDRATLSPACSPGTCTPPRQRPRSSRRNIRGCRSRRRRPRSARLSSSHVDEALAWCERERAGLVAATRLAAEFGLQRSPGSCQPPR